MNLKINFPNRKESEQLHQNIISDFEDMKDVTGGKNIQVILEKLAEKYGYSCGQAVRNMMNLRKRKSKVCN